MRVSYRQGLVSAQADYLQIGQSDSRYVDLIVSPIPTIAIVSSGTKDYLIGEYRTVTNAWGPFEGPSTRYLYWEINQTTGLISRGATTLSPISSASEPASTIGQMWWDTISNIMKVYNGTRWVECLRVMAGILQSGGILVPEVPMSQVGLTTPVDAGFILFDGLGAVFRNNLGELLTTNTNLASIDTGSLVKISGANVTAQTNESIPKFSVVYLAGGRASLASSVPPDNEVRAPIAMITVDAYQNDTVNLVTAGQMVVNQQWDWQIADMGKPVFCNAVGGVTTALPNSKKNVRVGTIFDAKSILLSFDWVSEVVGLVAGVSGLAASSPLNLTGPAGNPTINIAQASSAQDGYIQAADFARIPAVEVALTSKSDVGHGHVISDTAGLQTALNGKSDVGHGHVMADVVGLDTALAGKTDVGHSHVIADTTGLQSALNGIALKADKVSGAIDGNFAGLNVAGNLTDSGFTSGDFALVIHQHAIPDITGLQLALDDKSDISHGHVITDVAGLSTALSGKSDVGHTHTVLIGDISGLQAELDDKSNIAHTHTLDALSNVTAPAPNLNDVLSYDDTLSIWINKTLGIGDVNGLQGAIDAKANVIHSHVIADTTGLQIALNSKADVNHSHVVADTTGLQIALNGKADISHTHTLSGSLTDVDLVTVLPVNGQFLKFNGTQWIAGTVVGGGGANNLFELNDVDLTTVPPVNTNVLQYNGTTWVPGAAGGGGNTLMGLSDVQNLGPADGQILRYNATLSKWQHIDPDSIITTFGFSFYNTLSTYDGNPSNTWESVTPWQLGGSPKVDWDTSNNKMIFNKVGTYKITIQCKIRPGSGTASLMPDDIICGTGISNNTGYPTILSEDQHTHFKTSNSTTRNDSSYGPQGANLYESYSFADHYTISTMNVGDAINIYSHTYNYGESIGASTVLVSAQVWIQQISNIGSMPV